MSAPGKKNDGLHSHSCQNNVETAAAPSNTIRKDSAMSVTIDPTRTTPPAGFTRIDPTDPDSAWSRDDLSIGCEYDVSYTLDGQLQVFAYGQEVPIEDIAAAIQDLTRFWCRVRTVQAEIAARH